MSGLFQQKIIRLFAICLALFFAACLTVSGAIADQLPAPTDRVVLTVSGKIQNHSLGDVAEFDMAQIEALGLQTLITSNPFFEGTAEFSGVLLSKVLDKVGYTGTKITAWALDGYSADIPTSDAFRYPVLLATQRDGKYMSVREKGPLWIIYPIDKFPELKTASFSAKSVWQLNSLVIK